MSPTQMAHLNWQANRQTLFVLGLFGVFLFSWASHSVTLFNGLASPLFFVLAAYLVVLAFQYKVSVSLQSLICFLLFATWVVFVDAGSCEFLPALAIDTHWLILPVSVLLLTQLFREYPHSFQAIRAGAAFCIVFLLLTMYLLAEWYAYRHMKISWVCPPIFGHIRHLGLSVGVMTIFLVAKTEIKNWGSVLFHCIRILGLALVFWSGTRASMLAWVCCMAIFIYIDRSWARVLLLDTIAGIMLSLSVGPALPHSGTLLRSFNATSVNALSSSRLDIWESTLFGLNAIERLWTGVGGNGFARLQVRHGIAVGVPCHVQAHNVVIQSICDWGLFGVVLLIGFFYQSTVKPILADRKKNDPTALAVVVYLLITGMLDATLYHLEFLNYLAIALAYLNSQKRYDDSKDIVIPAPIVIAFLLGLALIHTQTFDYRIGLDWYFRTQ